MACGSAIGALHEARVVCEEPSAQGMRWKASWDLLEDLETRGLRMDVVAHNVAASSLEKAPELNFPLGS